LSRSEHQRIVPSSTQFGIPGSSSVIFCPKYLSCHASVMANIKRLKYGINWG
jgi:hypothetical protein